MFRQVIFIFALFIALASASTPKPNCTVILCAFGTKCVDTPTGGKCVPVNPNCSKICKFGFRCVKTPKGEQCIGDCTVTLCAPGTVCIGSTEGVTCEKPKPTCATILCADGFRCVETPNGGKCEPCFCTADYSPVCCQFSDGTTKTTSNDCHCTGCAPYNKVLYKGKCRRHQ